MATFDLQTFGIPELRTSLATSDLTSTELTRACFSTIDALNDKHRAMLIVNPQAQAIAAALDADIGRAGFDLGPLHGLPIAVKDNLDTADGMPTTAGSLALANTHAQKDSDVVAALREAGAVLIGKTNLSEWANYRSTRSSSGWSSAGGQTRNAYDPARSPGGSSSGSGVAVALGMCVAAIGTETDGSITIPAAMNGIVGIKPTLGLVSQNGIVPIAASQDTAGPMARSVRDAALLMDALVSKDNPQRGDGYDPGVDAMALDGIRLGVAARYAGLHDGADQCFEAAKAVLRELGAVVVEDGIDVAGPSTIRDAESVVLSYEFKHYLNQYLSGRDSRTTIRSLADLIRFNADNASTVMPHFGQELHLGAQRRGALTDEVYREARQRSLQMASAEGIDKAMREHALDAIIAPTTTPAWLIDWISGDNRKGSAAPPAAVAGYPHITVPMGYVAHLPVGLSVFAGAFQEAHIIRITHAFEQATQHRQPPSTQPNIHL
ncbi:MAG: amidase [Chromatiales bacterium]|jgi:amidase|nr:amidase [Chromatiales bacterium]